MSSVFEALSHPTRRAILELLKDGSKTAGELADAFDVSKATMSGHFSKLKAANLVQGDKIGTSVVYSVNMSVLEEALQSFMSRVGLGQKSESQTTEMPS